MREDGESEQIEMERKPTERKSKKNSAKNFEGDSCFGQEQKVSGSKQLMALEEVDLNCNYARYSGSPLDEKSISGASNNKIHSILKEFGEMHSFKSIKIEELKFEYEELPEAREDKENKCGNAFHNVSVN